MSDNIVWCQTTQRHRTTALDALTDNVGQHRMMSDDSTTPYDIIRQLHANCRAVPVSHDVVWYDIVWHWCRNASVSLRCHTTSCIMWTAPLNQCVQLQQHWTTSSDVVRWYDIVRCRAQCEHRLWLDGCCLFSSSDKYLDSHALTDSVFKLRQLWCQFLLYCVCFFLRCLSHLDGD